MRCAESWRRHGLGGLCGHVSAVLARCGVGAAIAVASMDLLVLESGTYALQEKDVGGF